MYSENPSDFPNVRFPFAKLVARDSQLTIHKPSDYAKTQYFEFINIDNQTVKLIKIT